MDSRKLLQFQSRKFVLTFQELLATVKTFKTLQIFHKESHTFSYPLMRSARVKQMAPCQVTTEISVDLEELAIS